ncbi:MAG: DUF86 domain-containing protein [Oscillatoriaceae cyanobacterium Prado104]|jgi:uncharacterized protein with HEPN domain|nr:DUF86 domain-containing protein [Oscillatoriaceae cyanobacterium Prado104]
MRDDTERVRDIQEAIVRIEKYSVRGRQVFNEDELIQTWVTQHLQIIGEASNSMSERFKSQHPEIPWQDMADFRNVLVHEYFRIDLDIVWSIIEQELPKLKENVARILQQM